MKLALFAKGPMSTVAVAAGVAVMAVMGGVIWVTVKTGAKARELLIKGGKAAMKAIGELARGVSEEQSRGAGESEATVHAVGDEAFFAAVVAYAAHAGLGREALSETLGEEWEVHRDERAAALRARVASIRALPASAALSAPVRQQAIRTLEEAVRWIEATAAGEGGSASLGGGAVAGGGALGFAAGAALVLSLSHSCGISGVRRARANG